jgi:hypothetical protein
MVDREFMRRSSQAALHRSVWQGTRDRSRKAPEEDSRNRGGEGTDGATRRGDVRAKAGTVRSWMAGEKVNPVSAVGYP